MALFTSQQMNKISSEDISAAELLAAMQHRSNNNH